jgi:hypothetical protein
MTKNNAASVRARLSNQAKFRSRRGGRAHLRRRIRDQRAPSNHSEPTRRLASASPNRALTTTRLAAAAAGAVVGTGTLDELQQAAGTCRMQRVMQPYLEAVL